MKGARRARLWYALTDGMKRRSSAREGKGCTTMTNRLIALLLALALLAACAPALAAKKPIALDSDAEVERILLDYIDGKGIDEVFDRYYGYLRRHMSKDTMAQYLTKLEPLTGAFIGLGTHDTFFDDVNERTVHIIHLCMERRDLDFFYSLNAENEITSFLFTLSGEQEPLGRPLENDAAEVDADAQADTPDAPDAAGQPDASADAPIGMTTEPDETSAPIVPDTPAAAVPTPYTEEAITVVSGKFQMPGVLTVPSGEGPFPAVLLVQGSGPSDRDETVGVLKPFRDIAQALAARGVASIRYDKRTYACAAQFTREEATNVTVREETIDDAVVAAGMLAADPRIDASRVFLAGHSLGAMMAPRVAAEWGDAFAGLIFISGTPLPLSDIIIQQNMDAIAQMTDEAIREASLAAVTAEIEKRDAVMAGSADAAKSQTLFGVPAYYFYEMESVNMGEMLLAYTKPILILQGGDDFQVTPANGIDAYRRILGDAPNVTYRLYPELNHPLTLYTGPEEYRYTVNAYNTPAQVDAQALSDIADFVLAH